MTWICELAWRRAPGSSRLFSLAHMVLQRRLGGLPECLHAANAALVAWISFRDWTALAVQCCWCFPQDPPRHAGLGDQGSQMACSKADCRRG